jgi:hypothetical protein
MFKHAYFQQPSKAMVLGHMGRFYNNTGMSSLPGNDYVNILEATNTDNNSEDIVITRC